MAVTAVFGELAFVDDKVVNREGECAYTHPCAFTNVSACYKHLVAVADTGKAVTVFSVHGNTVTVLKTVRVQKSPTGVCFHGGASLFISDRFGDIHRLALDKDTAELETVGGSVSTVTAVAVVKQQLLVGDRDEKVRLFGLDGFGLDGFLLAHRMYVSAICSVPCGDEELVVVGGGDPYVTVWSGLPVTQTNHRPLHNIPLTTQHTVYSITATDNSHCVILFDECAFALVLDAKEGKIVRRVDLHGVATSASYGDGCLTVGFMDNSAKTYREYELVDSVVLEKGTIGSPTDIWKTKYRKTFFDMEDKEDGDQEEDNEDLEDAAGPSEKRQKQE